MSTTTAKMQLGAAGLALAAVASFAPIVAQADSFATAPPLRAASAVTWGYDELDTALLARLNGAAEAAAVGAQASPEQLTEYLIDGIRTGILEIARGTTVIVGTTTYVALAFTGGVFSYVGDVLTNLPIIGQFAGQALINVGNFFDEIATGVAKATRVGPYTPTLG